MSAIYKRLDFLYKQGKIKETNLEKAIKFGWITEEEKKQIIF